MKNDAVVAIKNQGTDTSALNKLPVQIEGVLIEIGDLRSKTIRSTLIFKNIMVEDQSTWEETAQILANFITKKLNINFTYNEVDMCTSRAHQDSVKKCDATDTRKLPRPIF